MMNAGNSRIKATYKARALLRCEKNKRTHVQVNYTYAAFATPPTTSLSPP